MMIFLTTSKGRFWDR
ncbi:BnaA09g54640D [Brassica napus]|uniref:BnaA09g54640D protein n=1 Tax=Brassica napus TaxID=3708 RepID=A0A078J4S9_BRANA|nr:BnaA09g54640D [Brassica napus]